MLSLRLEHMTRFVGWVLLISVGILLTLLALTLAGGAIPVERWVPNPYFITRPPAHLTFYEVYPVSLQYFDQLPAAQAALGRYTSEWATGPIKIGALIAAGVIALSGLVYLWLRRAYGGISEEVFP